MAYSMIRRPLEYRKVIEDEDRLAAIDKLDELLEASGRLSDEWMPGYPIKSAAKELLFVFDDEQSLDYEYITRYMLKDGCELRLGGATYFCMGGIAWHASPDGLTYVPAFRVDEVVEDDDGALRPLRWYNEHGVLADALPGEAEDELLEFVYSIWRIFYSDRDGNIVASPCFASCPAAAQAAVHPKDRARMLEEIGSPWASLEPLKVREEYLPPWIR